MVAKTVATKSKAAVATGKRTTQRAAAANKAVCKAAAAAASRSRGLSVTVFGGARPGSSQGEFPLDSPFVFVDLVTHPQITPRQPANSGGSLLRATSLCCTEARQ